MYTAKTTLRTLLDDLIADMGLYTDIDRDVYRRIFNDCIATLYTDIIREGGQANGYSSDGVVIYNNLALPASYATPHSADIRAVMYEGKPMRYLPPHLFSMMKATDGYFYTKGTGGLFLLPSLSGKNVDIYYTVRPRAFTAADENTAIPLPEEHLDLLRAKLRGEIYKLANEDTLAAKWLGEYNEALPAFAAAVTLDGGI